MREVRDADGGARISLLLYHSQSTRVVTLEEGRVVVLGRDPSAELPFADDGLSRRHARFEVVAGEVWVEDLGSTNGTKLNGQRIDSRPGRRGPTR